MLSIGLSSLFPKKALKIGQGLGILGIQPLSLLAEVGTRLAPSHVCQQMTNIFADNWWDRGGPASLQQDKAEGRKTTGLAGQGLAFPLPSGVHYVAQG